MIKSRNLLSKSLVKKTEFGLFDAALKCTAIDDFEYLNGGLYLGTLKSKEHGCIDNWYESVRGTKGKLHCKLQLLGNLVSTLLLSALMNLVWP